MDDSEEARDEGGTAGEWFSSFTKRNIVLVVVFFLSNLLTAVSTLVTAVTVLREAGTDWRAVEYGKLRQLRAGYTLEKFRLELGPPVFRTPLVVGGVEFVRNVYRTREQYWVEVISNKSDAAVTYAVTTCDADFRPAFLFGSDAKHRVVLNVNTLSDVVPETEERDLSLRLHIGSTRGSPDLAFHEYGGGGPTGYREFAWGFNDVCAWRPKTPGYALRANWEKWFSAHPERYGEPLKTQYLPEQLNQAARAIMAESVINTYAEAAPFEDMIRYYPDQIGVSRLTVG
ncbi:ETEC_3214 domain-containing protein [Streptomyces sp. NPDC015661]|uniref:ETEC_3214 domain-containing protein n=1 Tax=Streptomyces sp. NPDC015661 TaxID=3364961 RepID=UPI0036F85443